MAFKLEEVSNLLARVHRCCCICHSFCGIKMETDHIVPTADGGTDDIDNAIPVCFGCHAEIHFYNDRHPRGRKFRPEELRVHRDQWLRICEGRSIRSWQDAPSVMVRPSLVVVYDLDRLPITVTMATRTSEKTPFVVRNVGQSAAVNIEILDAIYEGQPIRFSLSRTTLSAGEEMPLIVWWGTEPLVTSEIFLPAVERHAKAGVLERIEERITVTIMYCDVELNKYDLGFDIVGGARLSASAWQMDGVRLELLIPAREQANGPATPD